MIMLYAGIGFAMMATVLSIFETSITINKNRYTIQSRAIDTDKVIFEKH